MAIKLRMSKRILIFSTAYFPFVGGAEVAVKEITDRVSDFSFVMLTARLDAKLPEVEKIGNIEVHRIGKGNAWDKYRLILYGYKEARKLGPPSAYGGGGFDMVWAIMASYGGFAALRFKKRNKRAPFLLTLQEGDSKGQIYKHVWWCWPYFKQIFKKADRIQAISTYLAKWAKQLGARREIEVVPNGVDIAKFVKRETSPPAPSSAEEGRTNTISFAKERAGPPATASGALRAGGEVSNKFIITASRLVKKNGVGDLIKAMQFLPGSVRLQIAGNGPLESKLKNLVRQLHLEERVQFLGNLSHEELPKYLWQSDGFCRPSLSEGLGNAFLEAMAAGLPVVATPVGGIPDFFTNGETGLFCKVGDPQDIARQIQRILDNPALAQKLREKGRRLVLEKYNWDGIAKQMRLIFESLCAF